MTRITIAALFASTLAVGGCAPTSAVVNGQSMRRPTLAYTDGYYYAVTHYAAFPEHRGASSGLRSYGGRIAGFACGADFLYETDYSGRSLRMTGYVQPVRPPMGHVVVVKPARIEVRDRDGRRSFNGSIGDDMASNFAAVDRSATVVDFSLGADGLHGQIASRHYDLVQSAPDTLQGTLTISTGDVLPFELRGLSAVWAMEPADQAAIVPFMMTCSQLEEGRHVEGVTTETTTPLQVVDFSNRG
jgi:hypothetical protein